MAADAIFGYIIAARQFLWMLPSFAILAATAIERGKRTTLVLAILLGFFCVRQSALFFLHPREDWQAAADYLVEQVHRGAHLIVVPSGQRALYTFFRKELCCGDSNSNRFLMAITPYATKAERQQAIATITLSGYGIEGERDVGGSDIVSFRAH